MQTKSKQYIIDTINLKNVKKLTADRYTCKFSTLYVDGGTIQSSRHRESKNLINFIYIWKETKENL